MKVVGDKITLARVEDGYMRSGDHIYPVFEAGQRLRATDPVTGFETDLRVTGFDWRRGELFVVPWKDEAAE